MYGHTPLHYAGSLGNSKICKLLLESGADINSQDIAGGTPLVYAANHERMATIGLLLDWIKPDTAITYYDELRCPLYRPLKHGLEGAALAIMSRMDWKRNVSKVREEGTALHLAVMGGSKRLAGMIMKEMGDEVNLVGGECNRFALFEAVDRGDLGMVQLLLCHPNIDAGMMSHIGLTSLHLAAHDGKLEIAGALGARRDCGLFKKTKPSGGGDGDTAYDLAIKHGHMKVGEMLKRFMLM
jgi:ankyrin repeat protein